jgi:hypothetical protein
LFNASSNSIIKRVSHGEPVMHGESECQWPERLSQRSRSVSFND